MKISSVASVKERKSADVAVVPCWHDKKKATIACDGKEFQALADFPLKSGDFLGKEGEILLLYHPHGKEKRVLLVGLGAKEACRPDTIRSAYASAVKALRSKHIKEANFLFPETDLLSREILHKVVEEGVLMANYAFDQLIGSEEKRNNHPLLVHVTFCGLNKEESAQLDRLKTVVDCVHFTRDLVNGNADDVNVELFKKIARDFEKTLPHVHATILDKKALEKEKMGLLLAVGRSAVQPPALIILEYKGDPKSKQKIALVGKGIIFDTGGLTLKIPGTGMEEMKTDMAGAAAVLGTLRAAAELKLKKNLIAVLPVTENAIGPSSYKPGDVYKSHSGKTVEILSTDAEGRLVLADAISYVQEKYDPACVIDLATLTGGIIVALGEEAAGLFCNDEALAKGLEKAAERSHERIWRMPIYPEYKDLLKSTIADIKNSGPRKASGGQGAIFIQQFVHKGMPWAHVDIAGTAYLSEPKNYHPTRATGFGVRLLIDFLEHYE
jgi:leucyl aminopeptidase